MEFEPPYFAFEKLESDVEFLYQNLNRSSSRIYGLVQNEIQFSGIYNPKTDCINISSAKKEFESFQEILRNLSTFVYFNSLLLVSYSFFEVTFKEICLFVEEYSKPRKIFDQPKRSILKECRRYLDESTLVNFSSHDIETKYAYLSQIGEIRNLLAHHNGNILQDKTKKLEDQKNFVLYNSMKNKGLSILQNGQAYINDEVFIKRFIHESESFINLIIKQLDKK
jgi:hypothetical protein